MRRLDRKRSDDIRERWRQEDVRGLKEKLERILAPLENRPIFTSAHTLKRTLIRVKSRGDVLCTRPPVTTATTCAQGN